jgi:8-oxo-dGTP diphosphatase
MRKGTSIIFINNDFKVLLLKRDNNKNIPFPGYWDVPGGHVEEGETPQECIIREMKEEIEKEIKNPVLFNTYDMRDRIEYTYWLKVNFDISDINLHEGQYLKWFSENEINNLSDKELAFGFGSILEDFFKQKPYL